MKFLIDNQLPVALSRWFVSRGCDCLHVMEAGLAEASDAEIWRFACETERIVISKDEDFLYRASKETARGPDMGSSWKLPHRNSAGRVRATLAPPPGIPERR